MENNKEIIQVWNNIQEERDCSSFNDMLECFAKRIINKYKKDNGYSLGFTKERVLLADECDTIKIKHNVAYKETTTFVIYNGKLKKLIEK